jgi:hypothetical protein
MRAPPVSGWTRRGVPLWAGVRSGLGQLWPLGQNGAPGPFLCFLLKQFSFSILKSEKVLFANKIA